jgi:hypothetical protein
MAFYSSCFDAFSALLVGMSKSKLIPISLETAAPEIGAPDLTELRVIIRPFPKDTAERRCYRYLLQQMQAAPDPPATTKAEFETTCRRQYHVTVESFDYCWREAIKATGAQWDQPGRRSR